MRWSDHLKRIASRSPHKEYEKLIKKFLIFLEIAFVALHSIPNHSIQANRENRWKWMETIPIWRVNLFIKLSRRRHKYLYVLCFWFLVFYSSVLWCTFCSVQFIWFHKFSSSTKCTRLAELRFREQLFPITLN